MAETAPSALVAPETLRPFGTLHLFFYYLIHSLPNGNASEVVIFDGPLDRDLLTQTLHRVVARHPILNSVVVTKFGRRVYWKVPAAPPPLDIRFHRLETDDPKALEAHLDHVTWGIGFDIERERSVRFHYTDTPGKKSYLQIISSRLYNDGRAGHQIVGELAECYSALAKGEGWRDDVVDVPDRSNEALFLRGLSFGQRMSLIFRALKYFIADVMTPSPALALPKVPKGPTKVDRRELGAERLGRIKRHAKKHGATVHAVLSLALLRARGDFNRKRGVEETRCRVLDLCSLREYSQVPVDDLFDTMVLPYSLVLDPRGTDDHVLKSIASQIAKLKDSGALALLYLYDLYMTLARMIPVRKATGLGQVLTGTNLMLSNPGPVHQAMDAFGDVPILDYYNYSQAYPPTRLLVITSTWRGSLRTVNLYDSATFPDGIDELMDGFQGHLDRITGG